MNVLVFDTETTGLRLHPDAPLNKQPKIIEFGGALLDGATGEIVEELGLLIYPCEPLPEEIVKITGIVDAMLVDKPTFAEALPQISAFVARADAWIAHNLPFDRGMFEGELARIAGAAEAFPWPAKELCTVGLYTPSWGRNPKLVELYENVTGKTYPQTHRALDDVRALVEIVQAERLWELCA